MSSDIAISVENVSKAYRIWNDPGSRLKSPLLGACGGLFPRNSTLSQKCVAKASSYYRDFYALKDISLQVRKGESVGIIGRNGSGKSTILQIIAGTLQPTTGSVSVKGRVAALLELGSGFNPDFTGRENVYLNAAVLGLTSAETDARFDQIAAFADIGDFLDQPTKTYSSGMMVRLAFACAVAVEPDVLIVDEALSVGDVFFQQKCFERIRSILASGTTFLLVSHDLNAVQNLCDRAVLLENGLVTHIGPPEECTSRYYANSGTPRVVESEATHATAVLQHDRVAPIIAEDILGEAKARHGDQSLQLLAARICDRNGNPTRSCCVGQQLRIETVLRAHRAIPKPGCGIHVFDRMNNLVYGAGTPQLGVEIRPLATNEEVLIVFNITLTVQPGVYTFSLATAEPNESNPNLGLFYDTCEGLGPIEVGPTAHGVWPFYGIANLPMTIDVIHA